MVAWGLPVGLGSYVQWDRRLDARLAAAVMIIQAVKGVEIGPAFANARLPGTAVHDALYPGDAGLQRRTNRAGGLEGGMTNGEPLILTAAIKPIPTTLTPQLTVDLDTGQPVQTEYQRSDGCAVPARRRGRGDGGVDVGRGDHRRYGGDSLATGTGGAHVTLVWCSRALWALANSVGQAVADRLGLRFVDMDQVIASAWARRSRDL